MIDRNVVRDCAGANLDQALIACSRIIDVMPQWRSRRYDEAAKLRVERAEKARNNPPPYDDDEISR